MQTLRGGSQRSFSLLLNKGAWTLSCCPSNSSTETAPGWGSMVSRQGLNHRLLDFKTLSIKQWQNTDNITDGSCYKTNTLL